MVSFSYVTLGKTLYIFLSEIAIHRPVTFAMIHHLVNLYQVCPNYGPDASFLPVLGSHVLHITSHMFYIGLYRETIKIPLSETPIGLEH